MLPKIGYKTITAAQLSNLVLAMQERGLTLQDARVYLGCFEITERREVAKKIRVKHREKGSKQSRFLPSELLTVTSLRSLSKIKSSIRRLEHSGLLNFSPENIQLTETSLFPDVPLTLELRKRASLARPVPIPRRLLLELCRERRKSIFLTKLAYLLRGLTIDRKTKEIQGRGTVKASWIAAYFDLSIRAVKLARAELMNSEFISKDQFSFQRKLNRDGSYFELNLSLYAGITTQETTPEINVIETLPAQRKFVSAGIPVKNSKLERVGETISVTSLLVNRNNFAPRRMENTPRFAPPREDNKTPYGSKNQKHVTGRSGVFGKPNFRNVQIEDLRMFSRLKEIFQQAVQKGLALNSEMEFINWVASAHRAKRVGGDEVRIFLGLVRNKLWHHLAQHDEDAARRTIVKFREAA